MLSENEKVTYVMRVLFSLLTRLWSLVCSRMYSACGTAVAVDKAFNDGREDYILGYFCYIRCDVFLTFPHHLK